MSKKNSLLRVVLFGPVAFIGIWLIFSVPCGVLGESDSGKCYSLHQSQKLFIEFNNENRQLGWLVLLAALLTIGYAITKKT